MKHYQNQKPRQLVLSPEFRKFYFDERINDNNKLVGFGFESTDDYLDSCVKHRVRPNFFGPKYYYNLLENNVLEVGMKIWTVRQWIPVKVYRILKNGQLERRIVEDNFTEICDASDALSLRKARGGWEPDYILWPDSKKVDFISMM